MILTQLGQYQLGVDEKKNVYCLGTKLLQGEFKITFNLDLDSQST